MSAYPEWVILSDLLPWTPEDWICGERERRDRHVFDVFCVHRYREQGHYFIDGQPSRFGDPIAACTTREAAEAVKRLMLSPRPRGDASFGAAGDP